MLARAAGAPKALGAATLLTDRGHPGSPIFYQRKALHELRTMRLVRKKFLTIHTSSRVTAEISGLLSPGSMDFFLLGA